MSLNHQNSYIEIFLKSFGLNHVLEKIFSYLDKRSLANCRLVSNQWKDFIDNQSFALMLLQLRQIMHVNCRKKHISMRSIITHGALQDWRPLFEYLKENGKNPVLNFFLTLFRVYCSSQSCYNLCLSPLEYLSSSNIDETLFYFVDTLLKTNFDFSKHSKLGLTPLQVTCIYEKIDCVELILAFIEEKGINVNAKDKKDYQNPLHNACQHGTIDIVKLLIQVESIDCNAESDFSRMTPFAFACSYGHTDIVQLLLENIEQLDFDVNATSALRLTPFAYACEFNHLETMQLLLSQSIEFGIDLNAANPLARACRTKNLNVVRWLLNNSREYNINVNAADHYGMTPFAIACMDGHLSLIQEMINESKEVNLDLNSTNLDGLTPFAFACSKGQVEVVKLLLEHEKEGIDLNIPDINGRTPFSFACFNKQDQREHKRWEENEPICSNETMEIVKLLLENPDIDLNMPDNNGNTPFLFACRRKDTEIIELLLNHATSKNIDVNRTNVHGQTPFHFVCNYKKIRVSKVEDETNWIDCSYDASIVLKLLFKNQTILKIDFNDKDNFGRTPLHYAFAFGRDEIVKCLLQDYQDLKIEFNAEDAIGQTPYHKACFNGYERLVEIAIENQDLFDIETRDKKGRNGFELAHMGQYVHISKMIEEFQDRKE